MDAYLVSEREMILFCGKTCGYFLMTTAVIMQTMSVLLIYNDSVSSGVILLLSSFPVLILSVYVMHSYSIRRNYVPIHIETTLEVSESI
ncbi:hypothetical protein CEXT_168971 [Caerostris extrusa]|uniref:Uncharacterized protein n=1 Tax=Caerostris extrusa TaxID=172846 RepID=A0AAV4PQV2_CAEEX|nr:hypothetical protein CEXT_168971 [Caerostris extrusa]